MSCRVVSQGGALLGDAALPGGGAQLGARPHGLAAPAEGAAKVRREFCHGGSKEHIATHNMSYI